jgi:hypothetical protein
LENLKVRDDSIDERFCQHCKHWRRVGGDYAEFGVCEKIRTPVRTEYGLFRRIRTAASDFCEHWKAK